MTIVIAVGGGVVGDLSGFVAATYARGLRFCQVPTTLLAQVDSSVGGKTGVNLPGAKNMVGAFWQPSFVLIDTDVLTTLPTREYVSGLAEVVKYGVIQDANFFEFLEQHVSELRRRDADTLRHVIARCCRLKADVVEADERETTGLRAILNYGHTFAHLRWRRLQATVRYCTGKPWPLAWFVPRGWPKRWAGFPLMIRFVRRNYCEDWGCPPKYQRCRMRHSGTR